MLQSVASSGLCCCHFAFRRPDAFSVEKGFSCVLVVRQVHVLDDLVCVAWKISFEAVYLNRVVVGLKTQSSVWIFVFLSRLDDDRGVSCYWYQVGSTLISKSVVSSAFS